MTNENHKKLWYAVGILSKTQRNISLGIGTKTDIEVALKTAIGHIENVIVECPPIHEQEPMETYTEGYKDGYSAGIKGKHETIPDCIKEALAKARSHPNPKSE